MWVWRHLASTNGALVVVIFRRQEVAQIHLKSAKRAFQSRIAPGSRSLRVGDNFRFLIWASPRDWTTVVGFVINRNAAAHNLRVVVQLHVTIYLLAALVFLDRLVFKTFLAQARVA